MAPRAMVDLHIASRQLSSAPDVAIVVGASTHQQILEDCSSMRANVTAEFRQKLKSSDQIEKDAAPPVA